MEVVFAVLIVSIVLREAVWYSPRLALLLMLLVVIVRLRGVIIAGGISILRHGAHVCKEGL